VTGLAANRAGAGGGVLYLAAGTAWLILAGPAGPLPVYLAWLALTAGLGLFLPGLANQITLARAYLAAPALTYAVDPNRFGLLAVTVALAGATDLVDGIVARRTGSPSRLGGALDPVVDGLFFGAVAAGLAAGGAYPAWLAAVVVLRYLLPALVGAALLGLGRSPQLRHTPLGQVSTTLIAVLLGWVALWRGLGLDAGAVVTLGEVVIPLATLATFANLYWVNRQAFAGRAPG
jgi:phosphatidylglycerophosphate synthase